MSRILIIANNAGGLYIFRKDLIQALVRQGHQVTALTPFTSRVTELKSLGIELINSNIDRRGTNPLHEVNLYREYKRIVRQVRPDLIITYTVKPNIYGGLVARMSHIPYAANITGLGTAFQNDGIIKLVTKKLYKMALKRAKVVFFENNSNADYFVSNGIIEEKQKKVLNGAGVDTEYFGYLPYPAIAEPVNFLFIGRIMKEKGVEELFSATKKLIDEGYNCKLTLIGTLEENYKEKIEQLQKEGWLEYAGYSQDVRDYIRDAHCSVLPSWHEGMSNTNLECASCGRPLITSDIPGCREAVIDTKSGLLCKVRDRDELYLAMRNIVQLSNDARKRMGIIGRKHMMDMFEKSKVVESTVNAIV